MKKVITLLLACISLVLFAQEEDFTRLTLDKIFDDKLEAKSFGPVEWLHNGSGFTILKDSEDGPGKDILKYNPETGDSEVLVPAWRLIPPGNRNPVKIDGYEWSGNGARLLIFTNPTEWETGPVTGDYWVFDLYVWTWWKIGGDVPPQSIRNAIFSPAGSKVSFIMDNNIFIEDLANFTITQLTTDGTEKVINGQSKGCNRSMINTRYSDLLRGQAGYTWSPDGKQIAYVQVDYTSVPDFYMINNTETIYPRIIKFPYIKVGQELPSFKVGLVNVSGGNTDWVDLPADPVNDYLWQMEWPEYSEELVLQVLNRGQDTMKVFLADRNTGETKKILTETDPKWIEPNNINWIDKGRKFIWMSERDGWVHAYLYSRDGNQLALLTPGEFDLIVIQGIDQKAGEMYYIASPENPAERYLYKTKISGKGEQTLLSPKDMPGTHLYDVSKDLKWAIHSYQTYERPPVYSLISLPSHDTVKVLEDNAELTDRLAQIEKQPVEFFRISIGEGIVLDGYCIKPPDFNPDKKYPLLFYIYGEPAGQTVLNKWFGRSYLWYLMLSQKGYLVMSMDNRGTNAPRGREWRKAIHRKLGIVAAMDHAAGTRALIEQRPYIDEDKIGIYGHSGGGQMSLNLIFRYPEIYYVAMPSSFVSNQRYYHPSYQERFMDHPLANPEGYRDGSPITWAHRLEGKLLIIHGTGDSNVHYQTFEALINELVAHKKQFSMMVYPNRNHGLREGRNTQFHLYELRTRFLMEHIPPNKN